MGSDSSDIHVTVKILDGEYYINLDKLREIYLADIDESPMTDIIPGITHCVERLDSYRRRGTTLLLDDQPIPSTLTGDRHDTSGDS